MTQPAAATSILAALEKEGLSPALIIIDTLARSIAGSDENSAGDMGQLVRTLDEVRRVTDATVLLIHHPPKNGSAAYRGSSVLMGSVDTAVSLDQKAGLLTITCEKQKDGTSFSAIPARLHPVGHSCALVEGDFADVAEELPLTRASVARHLVRLYIATGRPVRFSELRAVASKSTVDRALKQLKENQQVVKDEDGRYIPSDALIAKYREETTPSLVA